jgi:protein-S-isoprenylcysteine O-methyltransferase Ste14
MAAGSITTITMTGTGTTGREWAAGHENWKEVFSMNKAISLAFLAGGVLLLIFGVSASKSLGSDISRFFTGSPTDKAIWMLIGGVVLLIIGLAGLLRGSKSS